MGSIKANTDAVAESFGKGVGYALDVGCGNASFKRKITEKGYRYIGIDIKKGSADILGDAHNLPFRDATFSMVISMQSLEHLINPGKAVGEMHRVLGERGELVVLVPFMAPFHGDDYWRFSRLGLKELFYQFEAVDIKVPTALFTILGQFIGSIFHRFGLFILSNATRDSFSIFDKYFCKLVNFDAYAQSYLVTAKKMTTDTSSTKVNCGPQETLCHLQEK